MDSEATRPHADEQVPNVQQEEMVSPPIQDEQSAAVLADPVALTISTNAQPADRGEPLMFSIEAPATGGAIDFAEVAPAPPPPFAFAALVRYQRLERLVNIVVAGLALLILSPLMLAIAILVKLTSKGPVLYRQPRVGLNRRGLQLHFRRRIDARWHLWSRFLAVHDNQRDQDLGGKVFMIYKFRTMCEDAERNTGAVWAVKNDPRSTRIGCFLRKYRLDELPQLFNVLVGDMNIVGPRPERPSIFARLSEEVEDYSLRQRTKPGITGWAQIHLMYDSCVDDVRKKVRYDLEYLRQKSIMRDLKIMAKTLPSMLFRRRGW